MKVIGAGFGRTGTLSMRTALTRLLDGPCYHMANVVQDPAQLDLWHQWAKEPERSPDWGRILVGMKAGVDAPICFFVEELMQRFPDAKVVLTVRDPDKWVKSFRALMMTNIKSSWMGLFSSRARRFGKFGRTLGQRFVGKIDEPSLLETFRRHNEHIQQIVPASRLLVMRVQDGWEPLCDFLGKPVPAVPFPHENEGMDVIKRSHWEVAFGKAA
jgi:hypothetical protein